MKWKNKGREFDKIGSYIKNKEILFLGCGKEFNKKISFLNSKLRVIEELPQQIRTNGLINLVNTINKVRLFVKKLKITNEIVIVSDEHKKIYKILTKYIGFKKNKNIFLETEFNKKYLSVYALYGFGKVYSPFSTCIVLTTLCSLNCKYCLNYQPYIKNKCHIEYEKLKKDIDVFFNSFDRVDSFSLTGGEPLLYKELPDLLYYIANNYRNKVEHLWFATNGTIVPSDELCTAIKDTGTEVIIDNYTKFVPETIDTYNQTVQKCEKFGLKYNEGDIPAFFKTFPPAKDFTRMSEGMLIEKFNECKNSYSGFEIKDGRLYACCYTGFANTASLVEAKDGDYLNLNNTNKKELIEFVAGFTKTGYTEFCKYCNCFFGKYDGGYDENGVTQQPKNKLLAWDIKNPTKEPVEIQK